MSNTLYTKEFATGVIDAFENFLDKRGIKLPSSEQEKIDAGYLDAENSAIIYGSDYDELMDAVTAPIADLAKSLRPDIEINSSEYGDNNKVFNVIDHTVSKKDKETKFEIWDDAAKGVCLFSFDDRGRCDFGVLDIKDGKLLKACITALKNGVDPIASKWSNDIKENPQAIYENFGFADDPTLFPTLVADNQMLYQASMSQACRDIFGVTDDKSLEKNVSVDQIIHKSKLAEVISLGNKSEKNVADKPLDKNKEER